MSKLENFIEKQAVISTKNAPIAYEFNQTIILLWLFRFILIGISVYCGYYFFNSYLLGHIQNNTIVFVAAIVLSLFVETFAAIFIDKSFKFILKRQIKAASALILASCIFYGLSFYSCTNGLALRQYAKNDTTSLVMANNKIEIDNLKTENKEKIKNLNYQIELIKQNPGGWVGNKRTVLTIEQLTTIKEYNQRVFTLENALNSQIEANNTNLVKSINTVKMYAKNEADKFYKFAIFIMIFQIITAGMIRFFKFKIYNEVDEILAKSERTKNIIENLSNVVWSTLINRTNEMSEIILSNFNRKTIVLNNLEGIKDKEQKKIVGFKPSIEDEKKDVLQVKKLTDNENGISDFRLSDNRICKHCGNSYVYKHHKQLYCSEKCRNDAWEVKTGRKLIKNAKKEV